MAILNVPQNSALRGVGQLTVSNWRRILALGLLLALNVTAGCGGSGKPQGSVKGSVLFQGQPVTDGTVLLFSKTTGQNFSGPLGANGLFSINGPVDAGDYVVMVQPPMNTAAPGSPEARQSQKPATIPTKYHSDTTSDLKAQIKTGQNELKLELLPK